jgi:hypothetical protein
VNEVYEGIADIALSLNKTFLSFSNVYLEIHRQIKVVVLPLVILIDHVEEGLLLELIRDISDHDGRPILFVLEYLI